MSQSLSTHQKRFNALKTKSLAGDAAATSELAHICCAHKIGTLAEIMPIVQRHLHTLPPLSCGVDDGWTELPETRNSLSTMTLLAHFIGKETPDAFALDRLCVLCPFLDDWISFLFRSMGIPDNSQGNTFPRVKLCRDVSLLLLRFLQFTTDFAGALHAQSSATPHSRYVDMGIRYGARASLGASRRSLSELGIYQARLERSTDVVRAAVQCLVQSLDLGLSKTKLSRHGYGLPDQKKE
ncbi:hypothetical protein CPB85DRAFT_1438569 [Mucidula mucida]|nr:hypothetical protein CPB85DRAFT_1438569 [Mucidula mucida]